MAAVPALLLTMLCKVDPAAAAAVSNQSLQLSQWTASAAGESTAAAAQNARRRPHILWHFKLHMVVQHALSLLVLSALVPAQVASAGDLIALAAGKIGVSAAQHVLRKQRML
jgi:hypothetical protein